MKPKPSPSVDREELARFAAIAPQWWDETGAFQPLHRLNATRLEFVRDRLAAHFGRDIKSRRPLAGLTLLDIGCGGGLMSEPLTRLGCSVTGIDADEEALAVARQHAHQHDLEIDYRAESVETLATRKKRYDAVLALEVVEHVTDATQFLALAGGLVKPGGALVLSTLNRTPRAYLFAILGAEYILRWLPRGTHSFQKFCRPSELARALGGAGLQIEDMAGLSYEPARGAWRVGGDLRVNYLIFASKPRWK